MAFLTIAGLDIDVREDGATEREREVIGQSRRAFAGNLRTSKRAEKRSYTFSTAPMAQADVNALLAATRLGAHVAVSGAAMAGGAITAEVTVTEASYLADDDAGFQRVLALAIVEV